MNFVAAQGCVGAVGRPGACTRCAGVLTRHFNVPALTDSSPACLAALCVPPSTPAGDVYRRDSIDATHYPVFHQMEGVRVYSPADWEAAGMEATAFAEKELKSSLEVSCLFEPAEPWNLKCESEFLNPKKEADGQSCGLEATVAASGFLGFSRLTTGVVFGVLCPWLDCQLLMCTAAATCMWSLAGPCQEPVW